MTMLTIQDVAKQTGMKPDFLRKAIKALDTELAPFLSRGEHNTLLINQSAWGIVDRIKQLKEAGHQVPNIVKAIKAELAQTDQNVQKPLETKPKIARKLDQFLEYERQLRAADKARFEAECTLERYKNATLLLTHGQSSDVEAISKIQEQQAKIQEKRAEARGKRLTLADEIQRLKWYQGKRRREIASELKEMDKAA